MICQIRADEEMPYLTREYTVDKYGVKHPKGIIERVDMITNPLAIINRTIPMVMLEGSVTYIQDIARKHAATLETNEERKEFLFDIMKILNEKEAKEFENIYDGLSDREKVKFIDSTINLNRDGTLRTDDTLYIRWEAFEDSSEPDYKTWRDKIIQVYEKYPDIFTPYHIFVPKPKWGRDIYIGSDNIGYQYMMMLKQSGEKGFSVRSSGSISDEGLPEKSHENKIGKSWYSSKPIRFGEYEMPNFMIITNPEDFALITALYRSSVDGRKYMYEAILSDDNKYNIPDSFTSRTSEILQVYLKSLGVEMQTIDDEDEFIGQAEDEEIVNEYRFGDATILCTKAEYYYLNKLIKTYVIWMKLHPHEIGNDYDEMMEWVMDNIPFKKKHLTDNIVQLFKNNLSKFARLEDE